MDVRTDMLAFPRFRGPNRRCAPGRLRDIQPQDSLFGLISVSLVWATPAELLEWKKMTQSSLKAFRKRTFKDKFAFWGNSLFEKTYASAEKLRTKRLFFCKQKGPCFKPLSTALGQSVLHSWESVEAEVSEIDLCWEPAHPLQRSLGTFGPEVPNKSEKCLPGWRNTCTPFAITYT